MSALSPFDARPRLVQPLWRTHAGLDGQAAHVLPSLLQQADQVVDGQHDIRDYLILRHAHISDRNTQAQYFLELEFDRRLDFGDLGVQVFVVGDWGGEFAGYTFEIGGSVFPWAESRGRKDGKVL